MGPFSAWSMSFSVHFFLRSVQNVIGVIPRDLVSCFFLGSRERSQRKLPQRRFSFLFWACGERRSDMIPLDVIVVFADWHWMRTLSRMVTLDVVFCSSLSIHEAHFIVVALHVVFVFADWDKWRKVC